MNKKYLYRSYRDDVFLGVITNVVSEFSYSQDINSAGSVLNMKVALTIDNSGQANETIDDETGAIIQDEAGGNLLSERALDVFGNSNEAIMLRNGNIVEVYEISSYYPSGKKMFSGIINRLEGNFSGDSFEEIITVLIYSRGSELDHYIVQDTLQFN